MEIGRDIIGSLAKQFGYSKRLVRDALQSNQIDPLTASMIGSRIDRMQQAKQQAASRTTVVEDVLAPTPEEMMGQGQGIAAAPQQAPTALAALPSNLPAQGMAGGGIVAFAEGDLVDEDEYDDSTEDREEAKQLGILESLMNQAAMRGATRGDSMEGISGLGGMQGASEFGGLRSMPQGMSMPGLTTREPLPRGGEEGLKAPPELLSYVLQKESGGRRYDREGRLLTSPKGARGEMQVMPNTSRDPGFGVTPARDDSPEELARVGRDYLDALYRKYEGNEKLTAMAYNWGPGNVDRWLNGGADPKKVPQETRRYVASLAEGGITSLAGGGIVAFQNRGLVGSEFGAYSGEDTVDIPDEMVTVQPFDIDPMTGQKLFSGYRSPMQVKKEPRREPFGVTKPKPDTSPLPVMGPTDDELNRFAPAAGIGTGISLGTADKTEEGAGKKEDIFGKYLSILEGREKAAKDQRKQDAYMSLLSAGLGMMSGTSPYAAVNIGGGAQQGVATQAALRKAQAAEDAATLRGYGAAYTAQQSAELRRDLASQAQEAKIPQQLAAAKQNVMKNIVAAKKLDITSLDQNQLAEIDKQTELALAKDPGYQALYKKLYGVAFTPAPVAAPAVDYQKAYGIVPRKP